MQLLFYRSISLMRSFGKRYLLMVIMLNVLFLSILACGSKDSIDSTLTYSINRSTFDITVTGKGELEAKKSYAVSTPNLRRVAPTISYLVPEGTKVKKGDIVVELEAEKIQNDYLNALDEVEIARAEAQKRDAELNLEKLLLESQIQSTEASLAISKLQLTKLEFEPGRVKEIRRLEIARDEVEAAKNRKKLVSLAEIQKEERIRLQLLIDQAESKLERAKKYLSQLLLKAPVDGYVVYERNWSTGNKVQEGEGVYPSMPIVKVPDLSVMQLNLKLGETDAQKLSKGNQAIVTVPTIDGATFTGKVSRIDKIAKPIKRNSKVKKVEVIVEIDSTTIQLVPGITAEGRIIVENVQDAFVIPKECVFDKDSLKIVFVRNKNHFVPQVVSISRQDDDFFVIKEGLKEGDQCALREPSSSLVHWPDRLMPEKEKDDV